MSIISLKTSITYNIFLISKYLQKELVINSNLHTFVSRLQIDHFAYFQKHLVV